MTAIRTAAWLLTALIAGPAATIVLATGALCFRIAIRNFKKSLHALAWT